MQNQTLDISWHTIVKFLITAFSLYLLFLIREIVVWFVFALIISILLDPAINFLRRLFFPKFLAVIIIYLSIFGFLGIIIFLTAPIFIYEINQFSKNIPDYFAKINPILRSIGIQVAQNFENLTSVLVYGLKQSSTGIIHALTTFFGGLLSTFIIFSLAFFLSLEEKGPEKVLAFLSPKKYEQNVASLFEKAQLKVSGWFGARLLACLFVAVASFISFYLMDIKYAFILALLSGFLNFIPYIGPAIILILVTLVAGVSGGIMLALYALIVVAIIQQIENQAITPVLMKKFVNLPPVLVLISILIGGTLFGFLGVFFAVPVCGIIYEFLKEFLLRKKEQESIPQYTV